MRTGTEMGAYTHKKGWLHDGLCRLAKRSGANAFSRGNLKLSDLKEHVDSEKLPIVSIKWAFLNK